MKIAAAVLVLLAACGCTVSDEEIQKAKNACEPFGGLVYMYAIDGSAKCSDGTYIKSIGN